MKIILFILLLFVIVVIHEFGHLIAAKIFGVYCGEFSFGMGPKLFSFKGKETTYSLRAFPLGGFVSMAGETDDQIESHVDDNLDIPFERTINGIHPLKRIIIMYAGIIMNFLLGIVIFSLIIFSSGGVYTGTDTRIAEVSLDAPAYNAGLLKDDIVSSITINGTKHNCDSYELLTYAMSLYEGEGSIIVTVDRNGNLLNFELIPKYLEDENRYIIGISFSKGDFIKVNIFTAFIEGFKYTFKIISLVFAALVNLVKGIGLDSLSGPVGIYQTTADAITYGPLAYIELIAILSVNVGVMNALPIPVMDGGRVLITLCEIIFKKSIDKKLEKIIMTISVCLLLMLFIFVTFKDIIKLF